MILFQIREFIRKRRDIRERLVDKNITILILSLGYLE